MTREHGRHAIFISRCFSLATQGRPSPNPFVGAVIEHNGHSIGEGFHQAAGMRHAEVQAIRQVKKKFGAMANYYLSNSTLYVSLEPCNHTGRQPPCTRAILNAKIPNVIYAMHDPNPKARGGAKTLEKNGVKVEMAGKETESRAMALNAPFWHHIQTGRAYVTLKMAISKDKQISTHSKSEPYLSSDESLEMVQRMRDKAPAIMVGIGTVKEDNPRLTCRMKGGHDPLRIIIDPHLEIEEKARVLADKNVIVVCAKGVDRKKIKRLQKKCGAIVIAPKHKDGHLILKPFLAKLAQAGVDHVLLEGGPRLANSMLKQGLVDEMVLFRTPKKIGRNMGGAELDAAVENILLAGKKYFALSICIGNDRVEFGLLAKGKKKRLPFWPAFFEGETCPGRADGD